MISVFSLNTLIGFACAIGIDMGFNSKHHHDEEAVEAPIHVHADGVKHHHHKKVVANLPQDKDDCCNDKVINFQNVDKTLSRLEILLSAHLRSLVFLVIFSTFMFPLRC